MSSLREFEKIESPVEWKLTIASNSSAYNKYMDRVDCLNQVRKSYGFDRKSRHLGS